ncbi:serine/threonine-protein kinase [Sorangium sp. KYC3313]|uniref:serine/threonine-protein kinase n=1 Tax=Sorangium sp. KYC3313 TaxID=3449740 RepID=UPI003F8AC17B
MDAHGVPRRADAEHHPGAPGEAVAAVRAARRARGRVGLDAAHENQIIHRDVKPDNIVFTADGMVKVVDFSIAKVIPYEMRTTQRNVRLGTAAYMAPENLAGNEADARVDVYSLGLVLWEMIAGRHPFRDAFDDRTKLVNWQFFADPAPLSEVAGLPAYVDEVIRRATAKQPAARYLSMAEMAQGMIALRRRLEQDEAEGRISLATPPGEPPIPGRPGRRAVYRAPVTGPTRSWCQRHAGRDAERWHG